jgi:hypothetical protein
MGTIWREGPTGDLEEVDTETGYIVSVQKKKRKPDGTPVTRSGPRGRPTAERLSKFHTVQTPDGKLHQVPKGSDPDTIRRLVWPVSKMMDEQILAKVCEGLTIKEIGRLPGFPPDTTMYNWLLKRADFKLDYDKARKIRGEAMADEALHQAMQADEDNHSAQRLKFDALKWGASVNAPATFGTKVAHSSEGNGPIGFIVVTGVPQKEAKTIEAEVQPVQIPDQAPPLDPVNFDGKHGSDDAGGAKE